MPIHDWTRVEAGIFHDFHLSWIGRLAQALNDTILPADHYALIERHAADLDPRALTLSAPRDDGAGNDDASRRAAGDHDGRLRLTSPRVRLTAETELDYYRRKQSTVTVRHVSGDRVVAMVEVVSPGNKGTAHGLRKFVEEAAELLAQEVHLLILDLFPPGPRDPRGIHGAIWDTIAGEEYTPPADKPLTLAAYESALAFRAYVEPVAVGDVLPEMPLFLRPGGHVPVPLEATYQSAWEVFPRRWRGVIEAG